MFDLNIDVGTSSSLVIEKGKEVMEDEELQQGSGTNTELSGTSSSSSVVNGAADESAGEFDFFSGTKPFVTQQLFPMSEDVNTAAIGRGGGGVERELELLMLGSSQTAQNRWLNLSVSGSGPGPEQPPEQNGNQQQVRRSRRGPRSRSSQYRGVTFYRRTGRWESHIWDCGKQVYLGGFDTAHAAARAYDRAAIKFRGVDADINFNLADYEEDMNQMKNLNKEEFVHILRRQSTGFSRGSSRYRGVTLHKCGRWEARMGQFLGKKCSYRGLIDSEVEAERAYDKAAIQCNGREALTNFEATSYQTHMPFQANAEGGGHNLDLNLGISITTDGSKASSSMGKREFQTPHSSLQFANGKRPMSGSSPTYFTAAVGQGQGQGQLIYGQPLASRQSSLWSGLLPGLSTTYSEANDGDEKMGVNNSLSNWTTKYMEGQGRGGGGVGGGGKGGGGTNKVTGSPVDGQQLIALLSGSSAASSGFSFSATAAAATALPAAANVGIIAATKAEGLIPQSNLLPTPPPTTTQYSFLHNHHPFHR